MAAAACTLGGGFRPNLRFVRIVLTPPFRLFDIATTLLRNRTEPDYHSLKAALLEGYLSVRHLDIAALDLFIALRAATYVGWIISRMKESGAEARNIRFVATARDLAKSYLTEKGAV